MKIKLLFANIICIFLTVSCNSNDMLLSDIPDKGRIAYVIATQNPISKENEAELSSLNVELDGEKPYYPEKPSTFITTTSKSQRNENYIIRFEKKLLTQKTILDYHNKALDEMMKYSSRNGYITSFTLVTITDEGVKKSSVHNVKKNKSYNLE